MDDVVKLRVTGKSLAATIPKDVVAHLGWLAGDYIAVEAKGREIVLRRVDVPRALAERIRY
jgi:antitoxin component of MazEF toxin-antitoxin module